MQQHLVLRKVLSVKKTNHHLLTSGGSDSVANIRGVEVLVSKRSPYKFQCMMREMGLTFWISLDMDFQRN